MVNDMCISFFMLKYLCNPFLYIPSICSNLICFKVQMTLGVQLGLDKPMKSIFEPEEDLNYFDKLMQFKHKTELLRLLQYHKYFI